MSTKTIDRQMLKRVQGVSGGLNWLATTGRPELAEAASTNLGGYQHMSSDLVREASLAVKQAKNISVTLKTWSIPRMNDGWWHSRTAARTRVETERHQKGYLIGVTNSRLDPAWKEGTSIVVVEVSETHA